MDITGVDFWWWVDSSKSCHIKSSKRWLNWDWPHFAWVGNQSEAAPELSTVYNVIISILYRSSPISKLISASFPKHSPFIKWHLHCVFLPRHSARRLMWFPSKSFLPWFPWFPWFHPQAVVRCNEAEALVIHILLQSPQLHPKISPARDASPLSSHPRHLFEPKLLPNKMKREEKHKKVTKTQSFATVLSRVPTSGWKNK